jgi:holdfast attachment protein HfaA
VIGKQSCANHGWTRLMLAVSPALALALAGVAGAQPMGANSASYNAGFGRPSGSENQPVDVQMTDLKGNLEVVNGRIQGEASSSVFASAGGAASSYSGAGGTATAIGNNLTVVTQGDYNTVIVSATQTNTGAVTATASTNGKP